MKRSKLFLSHKVQFPNRPHITQEKEEEWYSDRKANPVLVHFPAMGLFSVPKLERSPAAACSGLDRQANFRIDSSSQGYRIDFARKEIRLHPPVSPTDLSFPQWSMPVTHNTNAREEDTGPATLYVSRDAPKCWIHRYCSPSRNRATYHRC